MNASEEQVYSSGKKKWNSRAQVYETEAIETVMNKRLKNIRKFITERYLPSTTSIADMDKENFPKVLLSAMKKASNRALNDHRCDFIPLLSCVYQDSSQQMLTMTGMMLRKGSEDATRIFFDELGLSSWEFFTPTWDEYTRIAIPYFSAKEKFYIDRMLPNANAQKLKQRLHFNLSDEGEDEGESESIRLLENYIKFYRFYPNFHRVVY